MQQDFSNVTIHDQPLPSTESYLDLTLFTLHPTEEDVVSYEPEQTQEEEMHVCTTIVEETKDHLVIQNETVMSPSEANVSNPTTPNTVDINEEVAYFVHKIRQLYQHIVYLYNRNQQDVVWKLPDSGCVYLYHFKSVWMYILGQDYTLSSVQYRVLFDLVERILALHEQINYIFDHLQNTMHQIQPTLDSVRYMFSCYKQTLTSWQELKGCVRNFPKLIDEIKANNTNFHPEMEEPTELASGLDWLRFMIACYRKLHGKLPCTPEMFMKHFQKYHHLLNDQDMSQLTFYIEYNLGNTTLELISANLKSWLQMHKATLSSEILDLFLI